jgi:hypothetical protein
MVEKAREDIVKAASPLPLLRGAPKPLQVLLALALAVGAASCASDTEHEDDVSDPFGDAGIFVPGGGVPGTPGFDDPDTTPGEPGTPGSKPGGGGDEDTQTPAGANLEIIFLLDTSAPLDIQPGMQALLPVKVVDYNAGGPAQTVPLTWAIIDATGIGAPGDAELSNETTFTGSDGVATVALYANTVQDVLYTVEVSAEGAAPKTVQVRVGAPPTGDLKVEMSYEGPVALNTVTVRVVDGEFLCSQFKATNPPVNMLAEKIVLDPNSKPTFTGLPAAQKVTIVAMAKGPNGNLAGAGCEDGVYIEPDTLNVVAMNLYVLVLNPAGTYDLENLFDLTDAIPGEVGEVIDQLVTLFYDPGKFLINQIKTLVKQYVPGFIADAIFGLFEDQLAKIITDWVLNDAPDWVQDFFTIGQDLVQLVAKLELTGLLKISKLQNDYYVEGQIDFTGIILSWKLGCDKNAPDYDECGKYPFDLQDIDNGEFPLDLLSGNWQGTISKYDQLNVGKHSLSLNYGKLILFVLNQVILKELTGKTSLVDAAVAIVGCDGIADALDNLGIFDKDDIFDACEGAVTLLVLPLQSYLLGLEVDSLISLEGKATLMDLDDDLVVDEIVDGTWQGLVLIGGSSGNPFTGAWSAIRTNPAGAP